MIPHITKGKNIFGLLKYLLGQGNANEHKYQHVVSSNIDFDYTPDKLNEPYVIDKIVDTFNKSQNKYKTKYDGKSDMLNLHISLSLPIEDGPLTDKTWDMVITDFIDGLMLHDSTGKINKRDYFAVRHGTTKDGLDHVHLVINMIDEYGKKADTVWRDKYPRGKILNRDYNQAQNVCRNLEEKYEFLTELESHMQNLKTTKGYKKEELYIYARQKASAKWNYEMYKSNNTEKTWFNNLDTDVKEKLIQKTIPLEQPRFIVKQKVNQALSVSKNETEFIRNLRAIGLNVKPRFSKGNYNNVVGYSVAEKSEYNEKHVYYGGNTLDKELSLNYLRENVFEQNNMLDALKEWKVNSIGSKLNKNYKFTDKKLSSKDLKNLKYDLELFNNNLKNTQYLTNSELNILLKNLSHIFYVWSYKLEMYTPKNLAKFGNELKKLEYKKNYVTNKKSWLYSKFANNTMFALRNIDRLSINSYIIFTIEIFNTIANIVKNNNKIKRYEYIKNNMNSYLKNTVKNAVNGIDNKIKQNNNTTTAPIHKDKNGIPIPVASDIKRPVININNNNKPFIPSQPDNKKTYGL